ncbi:MAG: acyltransferase [Clostridia bacterium]|nr:acyltransferase [Clostridia bacterium]
MKNKKGIMLFSALLIVIFHLWIPVSIPQSQAYEFEAFLKRICYIGVDIFFFLSAYSYASKERKFKDFILNRFKKIYIPFVVFSVVMLIYSSWDISRFLLTVSGVNLFIRGGGSFLWFIPAIMIVYLILPLYDRLYRKNSILAPVIAFIVYFAVAATVTNLTNYTSIFIMLNRFPIIIIGHLLAKKKVFENLSDKKTLALGLLFFIAGFAILYLTRNTFYSFIREFYYVVSIPLSMGCMMLISLVKPNRFIDSLGELTLEMYGLQMIFGGKIATAMFRLISIKLLSNIATIVIVIALSFIVHILFNKVGEIKWQKA